MAEAVVSAAQASGARLVHLSTEAVLDGQQSPYLDDAPPCPVSPYGKAKAEAGRCRGEGGRPAKPRVGRRAVVLEGGGRIPPLALPAPAGARPAGPAYHAAGRGTRWVL
ncbi:MAG: sugar nucleotide-binding protein [Ardenticatenia bacterium]|nr:sugar nucleotide-binding protein [Ardenticatenia bacterium]